MLLIRKLRNISTEKKSVKTYYGKLCVTTALQLVPGNKVLTVNGIGTITSTDYDDLNKETIYIVSTRRGTLYRRFTGIQLAQYVVIHHKWVRGINTEIHLPLSFSDYDYILEQDQLIIYRITKRGYAKLVPEDREYYDHFATINRSKNGYNIYKELKKKGYVLKKRIITEQMVREIPDSARRNKRRKAYSENV